MGELIRRKFERPGDVERVRFMLLPTELISDLSISLQARDYVSRSSALQRTRTLAQEYADKAKEVLRDLPESEAKSALEVLTERVIGRKS